MSLPALFTILYVLVQSLGKESWLRQYIDKWKRRRCRTITLYFLLMIGSAFGIMFIDSRSDATASRAVHAIAHMPTHKHLHLGFTVRGTT